MGFGEDYEYDLMDYDPIQTETYAENLVALGHPDWEGRMSGTVEEEATAQYIISEFASMGLSTQLNSFEVPMHKVNSEPSLRVCVQGSVGFGNTPCEGPTAFGSEVTEFQHRVDYVIQGFLGSVRVLLPAQCGPLTDLGNGSDDSLWSTAVGNHWLPCAAVAQRLATR